MRLICVAHCKKCDTYSKVVGRYDQYCDCGCKADLEMVEKWSENDPNVKAEQTNIAYKENIRYSASLGVSKEQLTEARKLHPGVEWKRFGNSYRPKIHNRPEKLKIMRQAGFSEFPANHFEQQWTN